jgi:hypothetical protein
MKNPYQVKDLRSTEGKPIAYGVFQKVGTSWRIVLDEHGTKLVYGEKAKAQHCAKYLNQQHGTESAREEGGE